MKPRPTLPLRADASRPTLHAPAPRNPWAAAARRAGGAGRHGVVAARRRARESAVERLAASDLASGSRFDR